MFWSAGCSLLRAKGFFSNLDVLCGGLGIGKLYFFIYKKINFLSAVNFFQLLVIKIPGSGSVFSLNTGSGSVSNEYGSTTLIKTPNPKCRLFLKIDQWRYLGGRCLSVWGPRSPRPIPVTQWMNTCTPVVIHTGKGGRGGGGEPVRRLEGRQFTRGVENTKMTDCISSLYKL